MLSANGVWMSGSTVRSPCNESTQMSNGFPSEKTSCWPSPVQAFAVCELSLLVVRRFDGPRSVRRRPPE